LQWLEDSDVANPELEPHNQLSSSFSYLPFQPTLTFDHPLQSGYTKNGYEANSQALLTGFSKADDISPKSYALVSSSSDNPSGKPLSISLGQRMKINISIYLFMTCF